MKINKVIGVDIGGSHVTAALVDLDNKMIIEGSVYRQAVNPHGTAGEILASWTGAIKAARNSCPENIEHVGFAMPGPFDYDNGICLIKGFDKYEALYELDIKETMSSMLNLSPENIVFRNDAACFLDGELLAGAAKGHHHAIGITLGTGLGSASCSNGHTKDAELSVLQYEGEIIEEFVSTRGLVRTYQELSGTAVANVKALVSINESNQQSRRAFSIFADRLAWFLCRFVEIEEKVPEVLVVGGNIALCWELFMPQVMQQLEKASVRIPKIVQAANGEHAALMGAVVPFVHASNHEMRFVH